MLGASLVTEDGNFISVEMHACVCVFFSIINYKNCGLPYQVFVFCFFIPQKANVFQKNLSFSAGVLGAWCPVLAKVIENFP